MDARDIILRARETLIIAFSIKHGNIEFEDLQEKLISIKMSLIPLTESYARLTTIIESYNYNKAKLEKDGLVGHYKLFCGIRLTENIFHLQITDYKGSRNLDMSFSSHTIYYPDESGTGAKTIECLPSIYHDYVPPFAKRESLYDTIDSICKLLNEISDTLVAFCNDKQHCAHTSQAKHRQYKNFSFKNNLYNNAKFGAESATELIEYLKSILNGDTGAKSAHVLNMMMDLGIIHRLSKSAPTKIRNMLNTEFGTSIRDNSSISRVLLLSSDFSSNSPKFKKERERYALHGYNTELEPIFQKLKTIINIS